MALAYIWDEAEPILASIAKVSSPTKGTIKQQQQEIKIHLIQVGKVFNLWHFDGRVFWRHEDSSSISDADVMAVSSEASLLDMITCPPSMLKKPGTG